MTSKVLNLNPEYYTIWNHRRRVLEYLLRPHDASVSDGQTLEQDVQKILSTELQFLVPLLMKFPKCYWIWNHRYWALKQVSAKASATAAQQAWNEELGLVSKMLSRDSRNFHGWDYRRFVVGGQRDLLQENTGELRQDEIKSVHTADEPTRRATVTNQSITESEYAYTTKMIKTNLSNFSAWHNRSRLIPRLLDERGAGDAERKKLFDEELALIDSAVFTDPYDQSLWYYHHFLMNEVCRSDDSSFAHFSNKDRRKHLETEIEAIRDLLEDTDDCKWVYYSLLMYSAQYLEVDAGNKLVTTQEMRDWLAQLRRLDPMRRHRWDDWERMLNL